MPGRQHSYDHKPLDNTTQVVYLLHGGDRVEMRYLKARDVLPADLIAEVQAALGFHSKVIAFHMMPGDPRCRSGEGALPQELRARVRAALKSKGMRLVYFPGRIMERIREATTDEERIEVSPFTPWTPDTLASARRLAQIGFTYQAIADAVGVSSKTVASLVSSRRRQGTPGHHDPADSEELWELGLKAPGIQRQQKRPSRRPLSRRRVLAAGEAMKALEDIALGTEPYGPT